MFTGIIRHLGEVTHNEQAANSATLTIASDLAAQLSEGDSVAVNGACLTVLSTTATHWQVRLMAETLQRTNLGDVRPGSIVNLERPLRANQTLDGHFVLGHIDGVCAVTNIAVVGQDKIFTFRPPAALMPQLVSKGSVALDGVSLTVVDVTDSEFTVAMMPYTLEHTTFGRAKAGYRANIETDVLGKYAQSLLRQRQS